MSGKEHQPSTWVAKLLFRGTGLYAVLSTFVSGLKTFLIVLADKGETMLFTADTWVIYLGMAFGIIFCLLLGYFFKYQEYCKNHKDVKVKFEARYAVAAFCTLLVSVLVVYVIMFYGLAYIAPETEITQASIAFIASLAIAGFTTYIIDACLFHPIVDGTAAMMFNKTQDAIREAAASEAAQKAVFDAIAAKAQALGLGSEAKIKALAGMLGEKGADNPNFPIFVQMLMNAPEMPTEQ